MLWFCRWILDMKLRAWMWNKFVSSLEGWCCFVLGNVMQSPGKVHLVLEYCKGGDLSVYVQRHGSVSEATAKHFMQQLGKSYWHFCFLVLFWLTEPCFISLDNFLNVTAAGLQVLRDNNIIHRDLKPQVCLILIPFNDLLCSFSFVVVKQISVLVELIVRMVIC